MSLFIGILVALVVVYALLVLEEKLNDGDK
jgi:hypothetical protein